MTTDDRIAVRLYDAMLADGIGPAKASEAAHLVRCELRADSQVSRLNVVRMVDHAGAPHVVVARDVPAGGTLAYELDIRGLRRVARREMAAEFTVDLRCSDAGSEI